MSLADLQTALRLIGENPDRSRFVGPRDEQLLCTIEGVLGGRFPPTYRAFLKAFGAGNFGSFEIYGVIDRNFADSAVPDGVWLTRDERISSGPTQRIGDRWKLRSGRILLR